MNITAYSDLARANRAYAYKRVPSSILTLLVTLTVLYNTDKNKKRHTKMQDINKK